MSRRTSFVLPSMITALAASTCVFTLPASSAFAATCNAAPKSPAPQGSHWYYRTDRSLGRKCWYLAAQGSKGKVAAPRPDAADDDADSDTDAAPVASAQPAAKPVVTPMAEAAARLTEPLRSPPPAVPPAADWAIAQATPSAPLTAAPAESAPPVVTNDAEISAPAAQQSVVTAAPEPIVEQAAPPVAAAPVAAPSTAPAPAAATAPERINLMQFVFVAFVGICLLAGFFIYLAAIRRRRDIRIVDLNTPPSLRMPLVESTADTPNLDAPNLDTPSHNAPSLAPDAGGRRQYAEIDEERLRRFSRAWKERAA